jgi:hypothetical protein
MLLQQAAGNYRYLPGGGDLPFCQAVVADPGYEIVRAQLLRPLPWRDGFALVERHLAALGRPRQALCSIELRCAAAYATRDDFAGFNVGYAALLAEWGLTVERGSSTTRTNVAPVHAPPSEQVLFAFAYTVPSRTTDTTFILSGATAGGTTGDTSAAGLRAETAGVVETLSGVLTALGQRWDAVSQVAVYTAHDLLGAVGDGLLPRLGSAAPIGLHWFVSRPPIVGLEVEIDARRVLTELRVAP